MPRPAILTLLCLLWALVLSSVTVQGSEIFLITVEVAAEEDDQPATPPTDDEPPATPPVDAPGNIIQTAGTGPAPAAQKHLLQYKFRSGDVVNFDVVHKMEIITQYQETTETARNESRSRKHYRVLQSHKDGTADVETVIDRVRMTADFGEKGSSYTFDSSDPKLQPAKFKHILDTLGKPQARLTFAPSGKMLAVQPVPIVVPAGAETSAVSSKPPQIEPHQNFLVVMPESPIAVGDGWSEKFEVRVNVEDNLSLGITMLRSYRLESVEGSLATISVKTVPATPVREPSVAWQLLQRQSAGTIRFDIDRGLIVSRHLELDKSVVSPFGPKTLMRAVGKTDEKLAEGDGESQTK